MFLVPFSFFVTQRPAHARFRARRVCSPLAVLLLAAACTGWGEDAAAPARQAAPERHPMQLSWLGPGEAVILARQGTFVRQGRALVAELPVGAWITVQTGLFSQARFHALRWDGQPVLFLKQSGPRLLMAYGERGPWEVVGIDARTPDGRAALDIYARHRVPLSVVAGGLNDEGLVEALEKARPAALALDFAGGLDLLVRLPFIERLSLARGEELTELRALRGLSGLTALHLWDAPNLADIGVLGGLPRLAELDLAGCGRIVDLTRLAGLASLRALSLLAKVTEAQGEALRAAGIMAPRLPLALTGPDRLSDITALAGLANLSSLSLRLGNLSSLRPLRGLTRLTALDLSGCGGLSDIEGLAGLAALRSLNLAGCAGVTEVRALGELAVLRCLNLNGCASVTDFTPLQGLTGLETLDLGGCVNLRDARVLAGLTNLRRLDLSGCVAVSDIKDLAVLTSLMELNLSRCDVLAEIEPLARLTALTALDLRGCPALTKLSPLKRLTSLTTLNLQGCNGIPAEDIRKLRKALPNCRVIPP